jgi:integrase
VQEVLAFFTSIKSAKYKAILAIAYGAGLRVSEVCALKPKDIDSRRMLIHVSRGKENNPVCRIPFCARYMPQQANFVTLRFSYLFLYFYPF